MPTALWNGRRAPVTLLGGYLGSGKTTIVNHLVRHAEGRRLVVLVNDVGAVNVDAAMIAEHDGVTMSLTNGCVCCSIADDLGQTLEQIRQLDDPPDHMVLELSGVAEPDRVAAWASTTGFRLDGVVVAVDAELIGSQLDRVEIGDTVVAQLRSADLIVLTKIDLVDDHGAEARARIEAHTSAPIVPAVDGAVPAQVVLGIDRQREHQEPPLMAGETDADYLITRRDVDGVTRVELERIVAELPRAVLRAKGLIRCRDVPHPVEVNVVGARRHVRERPDLDLAHADTGLVLIER